MNAVRQDSDEPDDDEPEGAAPVKDNTGEDAEGKEYFRFDREYLLNIKTLSFLGCATMNILEPPEGTKWGHFNNRKVIPKHVDVLLARFRTSLDNCIDENIMHIAVKNHWVQNLNAIKSLRSVDGQNINTVPEMVLTPEGVEEIKKDALWVMGGNHRQLTLKKLIDKKREDLAKLKTKAMKLRADAINKNNKEPFNTRAVDAENDVEKLDVEIKRNSKWAVCLYDRGVLMGLDTYL